MEKPVYKMTQQKQTFCTIIDKNYLPFAYTLYTSIKKFNDTIPLQVLIVDDENKNGITNIDEKLFLYPVHTVLASQIAYKIYNKYSATNINHLRWALKPILISHLLESGFEKVIFVDPDIFFVGDYNFLFDKLSLSNVILTPHWSDINPLNPQNSLFSLLRTGLYNAGFVAANTKGLEAMRWWAEACHFKMDRQKELGIYDDQKFLDILPVEFDAVEILKHKGCNLAGWNRDTCKREIKNNKVLINGIFEPIFIHFTKNTIQGVLLGYEPLLEGYYKEYESILEERKINLRIINQIPELKKQHFIQKLKHKLLIRTRTKRFLYQLAENL